MFISIDCRYMAWINATYHNLMLCPHWLFVMCRTAALLSCYSSRACSHRQRCSCLPHLFTWSLPLIIINKYDDVIFL